jgi:molybdopterin-guanine dinucleotide biosynthesis protein A
MGGCDKCLLPLNGAPLLAHLLTTLRPQVQDVLLNTNSDPALFADFGLTTLPDTLPGILGPLSGLLTRMLWSRAHHRSAPYILSVAGDMPFLPDDFAARLAAGLPNQKRRHRHRARSG